MHRIAVIFLDIRVGIVLGRGLFDGGGGVVVDLGSGMNEFFEEEVQGQRGVDEDDREEEEIEGEFEHESFEIVHISVERVIGEPHGAVV